MGVQAARWIDEKNITTSALFTGLLFLALLFYSLGYLHRKEVKFKRFGVVYLGLGIIAVTVALFFFSTKTGIRTMWGITRGDPFFESWQLTISLLVFLVSVVGTTLWAAAQKLISPFELLAVFVLTCLFGIIPWLPEQTTFVMTGSYYPSYYGSGKLSSTGVLWALVYNIAIFLELLGVIFSGYTRRETWLINLGALFLFLLIIVKYFDWFFTFLDKSIFFIGAGILLFVVGWFMERSRRYMISNIKAQASTAQQNAAIR